jgi:hypothetical protein
MRTAPATLVDREPSQTRTAQLGELRADRRHIVRLLAAGMAGAVGAAALSNRPVAATDGQPVLQGVVNDGTEATIVHATNNTALVALGDNGYGIDADGLYGNARFLSSGDPIVGTPAWAGTLYVDGAGDWWAATTSSQVDGQWRKLAGPSTAGSLHVLPTPVRVYDSRPGEQPAAVGPKTPLAAGTPRSIGVTQNASGVDTRARAALITLTVTATGGPGFVTVWPQGPWPGTSTINFSGAAQTIATTTVAALASGATFLAQSNTTTDVLVDVIGYYE